MTTTFEKRNPATLTPPQAQTDREWVSTLPTKPGKIKWRKNHQWEEITRVVYVRESDGKLVAWSSSYEQALPVERLYGEWYLPDLIKTGSVNPASKCVARKDIFHE